MARFFTPTRLSNNIRETPEGYLVCVGVPVARTGWQLYGEGETPLETDEEGKVLIYRSPEEVFHPHTVASYEAKSVTIRHPEDFVNPTNWGSLSKGVVQNVRKAKEKDADGEETLLADLLVTDAIAIQLVKNGLREVSCGYEAEYEQTGKGKGRQTRIIGNHIALVEEGRAGPSYAILDHKHKGDTMSKLAENMKRLFAKAVDEAEESEKKEEKKSEDADKKDEPKKEEKSEDAAAYDELLKMVKDIGSKLEGMMNAGKDEKEEPKKEEKKDEPAKDAEEEVASSMEERMKALEMAVAKILENQSQSAGDEDPDAAEAEEMADEKEDEMLTGDTKSRIEILAPGLKLVKGMDAKVKALEAAYETKEGQKIIHQLTGGKKPTFDSAEKVGTLFIAASEILKVSRGTGLAGTKDSKGWKDTKSDSNAMTPEKLNAINDAHWAQKRGN